MRHLDLIDHVNREDDGERKIQPEGVGVVEGGGGEFLRWRLEIGHWSGSDTRWR